MAEILTVPLVLVQTKEVVAAVVLSQLDLLEIELLRLVPEQVLEQEQQLIQVQVMEQPGPSAPLRYFGGGGGGGSAWRQLYSWRYRW